MSIEGLVGLIAMLTVGLGAILLPFFTTKSSSKGAYKRQLELSRDELIASYERVLSTLRDLEDDFKSQKMHASDYGRERVYWSQYGVKLLQLLEGQNVVDPSGEGATQYIIDDDMMLDRSVEEAIYNYRVALQSAEKS